MPRFTGTGREERWPGDGAAFRTLAGLSSRGRCGTESAWRGRLVAFSFSGFAKRGTSGCRPGLADAVTALAVSPAHCLSVEAPALLYEPAEPRRCDGESVFTEHRADRYTSQEELACRPWCLRSATLGSPSRQGPSTALPPVPVQHRPAIGPAACPPTGVHCRGSRRTVPPAVQEPRAAPRRVGPPPGSVA
jgi:hypothetical protein